jgi:uncharacterized protein YegP (UPF0339 family)
MTMTTVRALCLAPLFAGLLGFFASAEAAPREDGKLKFELYKDKAGEFRWRLKAANGAILATGGQGYKDKADAKHGIELVQKSGTDDKLKYEFFEDTKKEHRWRLKAANGQVIASASEGYKAKADAEKAVDNIKAHAAKAEVVDIKE